MTTDNDPRGLRAPRSPQAINGGFPWLEIKCSRCQTPRDVDLCVLPHVPTTCVHDLAGRLVCQKCKKVGKRPAPTMLQLARARVSRREKLNAKLKSDFRCYPDTIAKVESCFVPNSASYARIELMTAVC